MAGSVKVLAEGHGDNWSNYQADCVDFLSQMPAGALDFSVFSPPFAQLYIYSDSEADMGNCDGDEEFISQYRYLAKELLRTTRPGRLCAVHCKDLVYYRNQRRNGRETAGLRDFPGMLIRAHEAEGWDFHSRTTVWKCPVIEMQRTKAHGLLYKQLRADSTHSRQGLAEYILWFRRWPREGETEVPVTHTKSDFPLEQWQQWASPVWMDIRQTDVLNVDRAREDRDEKHICPLQLDLIERTIVLATNPGEVVFSPFAGIGSEGVVALKLGRKFIGTELKESYWRVGCDYLRQAEAERAYPDLLARMQS